MQDFIQSCKDKLGVIVELKIVFLNFIFYLKKNRYVAWIGNKKDDPTIKGLDGLSDSNHYGSEVVQEFFVQLVKHPESE